MYKLLCILQILSKLDVYTILQTYFINITQKYSVFYVITITKATILVRLPNK
jgi:hypothetical protein